ncbi:glycosyltransferase family 4 protein [Pedobacter kyonggii]|uniref:Colanic acid biosynthesis glycosyltransferase WcaL n=1 Tax=Pedobacter kyonggii TaxID=1926871 RepID=A0A4Q9HHV8_9SPHI|nr:glycosyltransferase family 4 protein [Pedobacter kyonggii]TBO44280.1 colanic acid biosynthesis glycosyltransferase WcaL [Pedobacter kyonggii]
MNLLYVVDQFPSSSEYFILNEILELQKKKCKIFILAQKKGNGLPHLVEAIGGNGNIYYKPSFFSFDAIMGHFYMMLFLKSRYVKILKELAPSYKTSYRTFLRELKVFSNVMSFSFKVRNMESKLIHAHFLSLPSSIAMGMSKVLNIPFSCSAHANDIYVANKDDLIKKANSTAFIVTCTLCNKDFLHQLLADCSKIKVSHVYHGIDLSKWVSKKRDFQTLTDKKIRILSIGRLVEKKGIVFLLQAIKILVLKGLNVKCSIIGDGPLRKQLEDFTKRNALEDNIVLHGSLPQKDIISFYGESDIFILPCVIADNGDRDGLPNVLVEALATGIPAISTSVSAITELITHEQTGILVKEKDPDQIAEAVLRLSGDPELCSYLSRNGREKVEREFQIKNSTDRLMELFNSINAA